MKSTRTFLLLLAAFHPSCAPMSNKNAKSAGAATGVLFGSVAGGIIGHQTGRTAQGAAIGAAAGGLYGHENGEKMYGGDGSIVETRNGN